MAEAAPAPRLFSVAGRTALVLLGSLLGVLLRAVPALAVSTARRAAASSGIPTGEVVKYGSVVCLLGAAFAFRREETPILTETPMEEDGAAQPAAATDAAMEAPPSPSFDASDDLSINSALLARMQQLASEPEASEEPEEPAAYSPSEDSSDGWGEGNTAVLEPPKPAGEEPPASGGGVLEGEPAVDFPPGFPLVDAEWDDQPAASEDQVAMLERMFGGAGPSTEGQ